MKTHLKEAIARVVKDVGSYLEQDEFPSQVQPSFLAETVRAYPLRGGKRLRPALLLWANGLLGGDQKEALPAACSVEIFHNWTLVHDDIIDEDSLRRGEKTSHILLKEHAQRSYCRKEALNAKFGTDMAILAGDIQQAWAVHTLLACPVSSGKEKVLLALAKRMQTVDRFLISGEAMDVEFPMREQGSITEEEIFRMISGKTAALLQFSVQAGGALALGETDFETGPLALLGQYAYNLGVAFQLRDDYLDIFGDEKTFGKDIFSDMQEGKPTPLYIYAANHLSPAGKKELEALTHCPFYTPEMIEKGRKLFQESGAVDFLLQKIVSLTAKAEESLEKLPENEYNLLLQELLEYLLDRDI